MTMPHDPADRSPLAAAAEALLNGAEEGATGFQTTNMETGKTRHFTTFEVDGDLLAALRAAVAADAAWRARAAAAVAVMEAQAGVGVPPDCTCTYFFTSGCRKAGCERRVRQAEYKRQLDAARRRYEETCRG